MFLAENFELMTIKNIQPSMFCLGQNYEGKTNIYTFLEIEKLCSILFATFSLQLFFTLVNLPSQNMYFSNNL
jgi:hypothetical protein